MPKEIKITTLQCGTMNVTEFQADITRKQLLPHRITLPVNAFLVQHPKHGNILIDTGWSLDADNILTPHLKDFYRPQITAEETAKARLEKMGIRPDDIDLVILTHLDIDHTCALKDFGGSAKRVICSELEYFYSCRSVYKVRQVQETWMPYLMNERDRMHFYGSVLGPVGRGFDVFGDDSLLCIYTPGHTEGMVTVMINQSPSDRFRDVGDGIYGGNFVLIASDAAFSQDNIDKGVVPGYGFNRMYQKKGIDFLRNIEKDTKCRGILFSHSVPEEKEIII